MKKLIIIISLIIIVIVVAVLGYRYLTSFQKVSVTFHEGVTSATLYKAGPEGDHDNPDKENGTELEKLTAGKDISLQNGLYYIRPSGDNITRDAIEFTVNDQPLTVDIIPTYSDEFLKQKLEAEQPAISRSMAEAYPLINSDYTVSQGTLYEEGDWYGALLLRKVSDPRDQQDFYRIVLHKENDVWKVIESPQLVLTTSEFKDVPASVLKAINKLSS